VVQRTNNRGAELLSRRFAHYSSFVAILLKQAPLLRHSATVKVVSEPIDAARENRGEHRARLLQARRMRRIWQTGYE
jgi:hypothetical protein